MYAMGIVMFDIINLYSSTHKSGILAAVVSRLNTVPSVLGDVRF